MALMKQPTLKHSNPNVFDFFERISWEDGSWYKFKTSEGTINIKRWRQICRG